MNTSNEDKNADKRQLSYGDKKRQLSSADKEEDYFRDN